MTVCLLDCSWWIRWWHCLREWLIKGSKDRRVLHLVRKTDYMQNIKREEFSRFTHLSSFNSPKAQRVHELDGVGGADLWPNRSSVSCPWILGNGSGLLFGLSNGRLCWMSLTWCLYLPSDAFEDLMDGQDGKTSGFCRKVSHFIIR